jgi:hypothetical protein
VGGNGAYINSSDRRGKTGIAPSTKGLAEVMQLQPVSFTRIDATTGAQEEIGFVAQDVQPILPEAVWTAGIPLRDTLTWDNWPHWPAAVARPDLFLRDEWAVAFGGDPVQSAINRAFLRGPRYTLQKTIMVKGAPVVEIYRRDSQRGLAAEPK